MKRKFVALMVVIVLSLTSLTACGAKTPQDIVSEALGLDVSGGSEVSASDTHGGFHGDGTSCIVLTFQDDTVLEQIKANADWHCLPVDETTQILVYGISGEENHTAYQIGPYLGDSNGNPLVPEVKNGYYFLLNRQAEDDAAGKDILERNSLNFTFGLYDTDTNTLYCCELDT